MPGAGAVLPAVAAVLGSAAGCGSKNEYAPPPPPAVTVAHPVQRPVTDYVELTGTTRSNARVDLRARVNGYLESIHFEDGALVEKGDLLFVIDKRPFQASLEAAQAKLDEAEANLKAARESKRVEVAQAAVLISQAQRLVAQLTESRGRRLLERGAQSREEYDQQEAALKTAQADVEAKQADLQQAKVTYESGIALGEAAVNNAKAAVTNAQLQLDYTEIHAPIGGKIGQHLVDIGNLVQTEQTLLATIEDYDPIHVYFTISEAQVLYFARLRQQNKLPELGGPTPIALSMGLGDEEGFPHEGVLDFAELGVDPATGTTTRRGVFPNAEGTVVPGLFARIRGAVGDPEPRLLVPDRALGEDQQGRYALVVNGKNVVEHRSVRTGIKDQGLRVIEEGLKPDDWVVVNGLLRARPGATVDPQRGDALAFAGPSGASPAAKAAPATTPGRREEAPGPEAAEPAGAERPGSPGAAEADRNTP